MTVQLNLSHVMKNKECENAKLHYLPCTIESNGPAKVSTYFEPIIQKKTENNETEYKASFRGYPLDGKEILVPENYTGLILEETNCNSNKSNRIVYGKYKFDKLIYWNWDSKPSSDDKFVLALDWLDVSKAVHSS